MAKRTILDHGDVFERGEATPRLFVFSDSFRRALLQLADRLYWDSAWTATLTDDEWAIIDDGHRVLIEGSEVPEGEMCEYCELIPQILAQLQELNNMQINVSSGCGCGCTPAPCIPASDVALPPDTLPPNPFPGTPTPDDDDGLLWKCNMAHYCAYLLRLWGINSTVLNGVPLIMTSITHTYDGLGIDEPHFAHQTAVASVATMLNAPGTSDAVVIPFDANYDAIVCAVYSALSDSAALESLRSLMDAIYANGLIAQAMKALATLLPLEHAYTPGDISTLPPSYQSRTCSCGSTIFPPPPPDETYVWLPLAPAHMTLVSTNNNGSPVHQINNGNILSGHGVSYNQALFDINISVILADARLPAPGAEVAAMAVYLTEASFTGTPGSGVYHIMQMAGAYGYDWYNATGTIPIPPENMLIRDSDHALTSIIGSFDRNGSLAITESTQWYMDSQGGGVMRARVNVYWLIKL